MMESFVETMLVVWVGLTSYLVDRLWTRVKVLEDRLQAQEKVAK